MKSYYFNVRPTKFYLPWIIYRFLALPDRETRELILPKRANVKMYYIYVEKGIMKTDRYLLKFAIACRAHPYLNSMLQYYRIYKYFCQAIGLEFPGISRKTHTPYQGNPLLKYNHELQLTALFPLEKHLYLLRFHAQYHHAE